MSVILAQVPPVVIPVSLLTAPHPESREPAPAAAPILNKSRRVNPFFDMTGPWNSLLRLGCRSFDRRGFAHRIGDKLPSRVLPVNTLDPVSWENPLRPPQVRVDRSAIAPPRGAACAATGAPPRSPPPRFRTGARRFRPGVPRSASRQSPLGRRKNTAAR